MLRQSYHMVDAYTAPSAIVAAVPSFVSLASSSTADAARRPARPLKRSRKDQAAEAAGLSVGAQAGGLLRTSTRPTLISYDRMMVWFELHGVVKNKRHGGVHDSSSLKASLNLSYDEYKGEFDELRRMTQDELVQKLKQQGGDKRKRAGRQRTRTWHWSETGAGLGTAAMTEALMRRRWRGRSACTPPNTGECPGTVATGGGRCNSRTIRNTCAWDASTRRRTPAGRTTA